MSSYYREVIGNLSPGEIAKSSDINHIQRHIQDSESALLSDLHNGEPYVLGVNEGYKNSFIITPAPKQNGRYVDSSNTDFNVEDQKDNFININYNDVKQPLVKTKTSLYSIITKLRNTSNRNIPITCEIQDEEGEVLRSNTITLLKNTEMANYEIVFDLDFYPTPPGLSFDDLKKRDGKDIPPRTKEESFDEGYEEAHNAESDEKPMFSAGVSKLYFVIKRTNLNAIDLADTGDEEVLFDPFTSLGVYCIDKSSFPDKDIYAEQRSELTWTLTEKNIYYEDIYANEMTYLCSGGEAIIEGEKVHCIDTHVSVEGGSSLGNVLTQIYMDNYGHLHAANRRASFTTNISEFEEDEDDMVPVASLPIALILTYSNAEYGTAKEPLIIQEGYNQLPRSHHERLRRLEKKMDWSNDIALPSRLKYTISDGDWINEKGEQIELLPDYFKGTVDPDFLKKDNIFLTTDENGNLVAKISEETTQTIPVTLKEKLKDDKGKKIKLEKTDVLNVSAFSTIKHITHDSKKGTLILDNKKVDSPNIATTKKEAKATEYNPWDDSAANRPKGTKYEKHKREYKVVKGKNGAHDSSSSYPGMTFYTNTNYKMHKLTIPIHEFENCSGVRFYIWRRQKTNNKKNTVWLEKLIHTSKVFSLKKAKIKGKRQYMDEGFTINFGKGGLSLPKAQYVIIALPIPKSGTGSMFVETYKPKNSKDFCIRYKGAANASHFLLTERYHEIWYNSASAVVTEENYYNTGEVISETLTWDIPPEGLERIKSVTPIVDNNITYGNKTKDSVTLSVDTGGGWVKVTPNEENKINSGGATTFKWKMEFKGDGKSTPKLSYNSKKGYAIKFLITREKPGVGVNYNSALEKNQNMCITSKTFDADNILRDYIGDRNFGLTHSRFAGYEFARIWADNSRNKNLLIDIQASDRNYQYKKGDGTNTNGTIDLWSLHYCDLTLDDFEKISVDYSDYDTELEYDENNMRLKLDSEHSYNDNDIQILSLTDFVKNPNPLDSDEEEKNTIVLSENESVTENQILMKKVYANPIDLTKYTGLRFELDNSINPETTAATLRGLGVYFSTSEERDAPSNVKNLPENMYQDEILKDAEILPNVIDPDESSADYYDGKLVQITHEINPDKDGDKKYANGFYKYIKQYDEEKEKYVWVKQQVFDLRSYCIYNLGDIVCSDNKDTYSFRIEINQNSNIFKHVKEIGFISLHDEDEEGKKYSVTQDSISTKIDCQVGSARGKAKISLSTNEGDPIPGETIKPTIIANDSTTTLNSVTLDNNGQAEINILDYTNGECTCIFEGSTTEDGKIYSKSSTKFTFDYSDSKNSIKVDDVKILSPESIKIEVKSIKALSEDYVAIYNPGNKETKFVAKEENKSFVSVKDKITLNTETYRTTLPNNVNTIEKTYPETTQINIKHKNSELNKVTTLCYMNNPYEGGLSDYKHIGIQLATDVYIPKDSLKLNICAENDGEDVIASVNLPTMNTIYDPVASGVNDKTSPINLSQIFKKFNSEETQIKSISISTTPHFYTFMDDIIDEASKPSINLFIGKIVLYKARTIPIYHNKMRYKFYATENGEIIHAGQENVKNNISIRKIGTILDYD